jgi:hypothetical protein
MTASVSCRYPLCALGSLKLGNWVQGTSDRGGQDKARKVRAVGRDGSYSKITAIQQTLRHIRRTSRQSATALSSFNFRHPMSPR